MKVVRTVPVVHGDPPTLPSFPFMGAGGRGRGRRHARHKPRTVPCDPNESRIVPWKWNSRKSHQKTRAPLAGGSTPSPREIGGDGGQWQRWACCWRSSRSRSGGSTPSPREIGGDGGQWQRWACCWRSSRSRSAVGVATEKDPCKSKRELRRRWLRWM